MKKFYILLLAISCGVVLYWGNSHWKERTVLSTDATSQETKKTAEPAEVAEEIDKRIDIEEFQKISVNWPAEAKRRFEQTLLEGIPYKILLAGSTALGSNEDGWASSAKKKLEETFGEGSIEVDIQVFDGTSMEFSDQDKVSDMIDAEADLIVLEPFTLQDNSFVRIEDSHAHITNWISAVKEKNPDTVFILQPPNPIYDANYYLVQIEELEKFAETNDIPYLNHWSAWPSTDSEEIIPYLNKENEAPSEKGHELWSKYVTDFFISK
ncbi:SGNH/GDSL hydrolase family protein [Cytobacillus oceanisediminis]|uniref:SGNH/GDSL hydrolase family protein n=1 Tax=Cytobacillus TaxID=2675230 RepID=UPI00203BFE78|nr:MULTISPECIES: SGNH/GDSL hydrolase family protein [Cytobacillus]MBY0158849.1 SGNH/GDSL hydrolase family protein [Cytobacillus firmus]MCM3391504.1 SGNH/GDSL hydrolase family protein [Cytobacillus oceanisediminis]MCM3529081.1 SGNH/GDSL hydrolase family protein [Cytobacillus oceanisediminis]UQX53787.1 SGNH/GDSL hydrolase family protein [Cytobacillus pseudoceanisediminis]